MKDGIDYMQAEMDKAVEQYGVNRQFSEFYLGWRAACEAAHARAEAKGGEERARYWASADAQGYYTLRDDYAIWKNIDGCEESCEVENVPAVFTPCTTEAEARRVAGFTEEKAQ